MRHLLFAAMVTLTIFINTKARSDTSTNDIHIEAIASLSSIQTHSPIMNFCIYDVHCSEGYCGTITKRVAKWSACPDKIKAGYNKYTKEWRIIDD